MERAYESPSRNIQGVFRKMNFRKELDMTISGIKISLSNKKYSIAGVVWAAAIFSFLYYFLVAKVANNDIWISVMMSGPGFITFSIVSSLITAALAGILFSMLLYQYDLYNKFENKGVLGFIGSGIVAFGVGCPTCGAFLFGIIGMPLALMYFPFRGLEIQVLGIFILLFSVWITSKSVHSTCNIKKKWERK